MKALTTLHIIGTLRSAGAGIKKIKHKIGASFLSGIGTRRRSGFVLYVRGVNPSLILDYF